MSGSEPWRPPCRSDAAGDDRTRVPSSRERAGGSGLRHRRGVRWGYFGWDTIRRYGFGAFQPAGYVFFASSSETEVTMITSWPCFQFTGVATLCLVVSWQESRSRSTSSKLRPVAIG